MTLPGLVASRNLSDVADTEATWDNLGNGVNAVVTTTNLALRSQELQSAPWVANQATVSGDIALAPDGTTTADKLIPASGSAGLGGSINQPITAPNSYSAIVFSLYAKAAEFGTVRFRIEDANNSSVIIALRDFSLSTLLVNAPSDNVFLSEIVASSEGWYRLVMGCILGESSGVVWRISTAIDGAEIADGSRGVLLWGEQAEPGTFLTPYKATTDSPVTNSSNTSLVITGQDIFALAGARVASTRDLARTKGLVSPVQPRLSAAALAAASGVAMQNAALLKNSPTSEGDFAVSRGILDGQTLRVNGTGVASISGSPFSGDTASSPLLISSFVLPPNLRIADATVSGVLSSPDRAIPMETDSLILYAKAGQG
jgi:hypothetical protein